MNRTVFKRVIMATAVLSLGACAQAKLQERLDAAEAENQSLRAQLDQSGAVTPGANGPPNPKPGECYARITTTAQFKTEKENVVDQPASESIRVIPATYKTVKEKVLLREASEKLEVIPATYKTVTEKVLVEPEKTRIVAVPAKYETVERRIKVRDAYTTWKPGGKVYAVGSNALGGTILENRTTQAGGVLCLVEIPAEYKTVSERKLVTPATTREETIPGKYKTVTRRVVDQKATTRVVPVPAEYQTVTKSVVDQEARTEKTAIPATYRTISRQVETTPAQTTWASVLCDYNATPDVVRDLQTRLKKAGHYGGPIDGIIGSQTKAGIRSYQKSVGVRSEILTMDSARQLGLKI